MRAERQTPETATARTTDTEVWLSAEQLRELIERAENQNYMITHATDGRWVRIIPYRNATHEE
ncbi:hypothetical protein [Streptomyces sp. NPDC006335]|uniref:hypothetical protein n=1 Tax=Streptomyces sp. NPDC006335 TaxID=3156895 RepID=UPI0033B48E4A